MPLTKTQKDALDLIKRSKCDDEGWYQVNAMVWAFIKDLFPASLVETREATEEERNESFLGGHLRLTEVGQAVIASDWL